MLRTRAAETGGASGWFISILTHDVPAQSMEDMSHPQSCAPNQGPGATAEPNKGVTVAARDQARHRLRDFMQVLSWRHSSAPPSQFSLFARGSAQGEGGGLGVIRGALFAEARLRAKADATEAIHGRYAVCIRLLRGDPLIRIAFGDPLDRNSQPHAIRPLPAGGARSLTAPPGRQP